MKSIGCYLKQNVYYVVSMSKDSVMVSVDGADELEQFAVLEDSEGKYFLHEGDRVDLEFADNRHVSV